MAISVSRLIMLLSIALALLPGLVFAQGGQTGAIAGLVRDPSGAVVPNASVEIVNQATGVSVRKLETGPDGNYSAVLLPPGSYRVDVKASGFKNYRAQQVIVRINETTRLDASLEVGTVADTVVVEATQTIVNTESATTGQPVDQKTLAALPLPNPNFLFLLSLSPGTAGEMPDVRAANRGNVDITVNGQRTSNNSITIEGINVNDFNLAHFDTVPLPNPSVLQEFKVSTSLYDATIGSKGGGALNLVLRTGSKDWHGEAYWSHRNDKLNANEWFRNQVGSRRARLLQNVFGVSGSGPVPLLGGFWFANFQGVRGRNGLDPNGSVINPILPAIPTAAGGDTSAALLAGTYGLTASQIDPVAVNILNLKSDLYGVGYLIPRAGSSGCQSAAPGGTFRCTISAITPLQDNQYTISYDRPFREGKDKITGRWFWDNGESNRPYGVASSLSFPSAGIQQNRFLSLSHTHLISPRQVNEFRAGFSRFISAFSPTDSISLADIGATRPNEGQFPGMYRVAITGLFQVGTGVNDDRGTVSNSFNYADTWSLTVGKHTIRAGGEFIRYQLNRYNRFASRGSLTFNATTGAGNAFSGLQNFLMGRVTDIQSAGGDPQRYFRASDYAFFVQEDWRISPRLTLNFGVRYELMSLSKDKLFRVATYDPEILERDPTANPFLFPSELNLDGFRGTPGIRECGIPNCRDTNNWAPRVGFAWDFLGNQRTVIRGGYGIYYQRLSNQNVLQGSLGPPFFVQPLESRANPDPMQLRNPLPQSLPGGALAAAFIPSPSRFAGYTTPAGVPTNVNDPAGFPMFINSAGQRCASTALGGGTAVNCSITLASFTVTPQNSYSPYTQQWNFGIQQQLINGWGVEAAYVGSHYVGGIAIWTPYLAPLASPQNPITVRDINGVTHTITTNTANNEPLRHRVLGLSRRLGTRFSGNVAQALYHSGQLTVSRRFTGGVFFQAGYTFSKLIDNASGSQSTDELNATLAGQAGANILNFQNDPHQNRAVGDFHRPHRLVVSYAWDVPGPANGMGKAIFGGWTLSGITTFQNGLPFSTFDSGSGGAYGGVNIGTGILQCRPAAQQVSTAPGCTPGAVPGSIDEIYTTGAIQDRLTHFVNPNWLSQAGPVPNSAGGGVTGYGNSPRNSFRGPFQQAWDFSVAKRFSFFERSALQFRADFFNLFNHPIFQQPSSVQIATPATFGQITSTTIPARLLQFGMRFTF